MEGDRAAIVRELEDLSSLLRNNSDLSAEWRRAVSTEIAARQAQLTALDQRRGKSSTGAPDDEQPG